MNFIGQITAIEPIRTLGNGEQSVSFIVTETNARNPQYPEAICLEIYGTQRIQQVNPQMGMYGQFDFSPSAQVSQDGRCFGHNRCWRYVNTMQAQQNFAPQGQFAAPQGQFNAPQGQFNAPQGFATQSAAPQGQFAAPQGQFAAPQGQFAPQAPVAPAAPQAPAAPAPF